VIRAAFTTTFATCPDRPGIPSVAPSRISMRTTLEAGTRCSWAKMSSDLLEMRSPFSSTLPVASPRPRSTDAERMVKPGTWFSMSSAFCGAKRAKSAGVKVRLSAEGAAAGLAG
jgi:hypothetical protein